MSAPRIRPVTAADIPAIRDIYNHYVRESTVTFDEVESTDASWREKSERAAGAGIPFLIAESDAGDLLGYAMGHPWSPKSAYRFTIENSVYLAPSAAGRGIGRALLAAFLDGCRRAGLRHVIAVIADSGTEASLALHRRAGFTEAGRLADVGEKFGRSIGVLFLQKTIAQPLAAESTSAEDVG